MLSTEDSQQHKIKNELSSQQFAHNCRVFEVFCNSHIVNVCFCFTDDDDDTLWSWKHSMMYARKFALPLLQSFYFSLARSQHPLWRHIVSSFILFVYFFGAQKAFSLLSYHILINWFIDLNDYHIWLTAINKYFCGISQQKNFSEKSQQQCNSSGEGFSKKKRRSMFHLRMFSTQCWCSRKFGGKIEIKAKALFTSSTTMLSNSSSWL